MWSVSIRNSSVPSLVSSRIAPLPWNLLPSAHRLPSPNTWVRNSGEVWPHPAPWHGRLLSLSKSSIAVQWSLLWWCDSLSSANAGQWKPTYLQLTRLFILFFYTEHYCSIQQTWRKNCGWGQDCLLENHIPVANIWISLLWGEGRCKGLDVWLW